MPSRTLSRASDLDRAVHLIESAGYGCRAQPPGPDAARAGSTAFLTRSSTSIRSCTPSGPWPWLSPTDPMRPRRACRRPSDVSRPDHQTRKGAACSGACRSSGPRSRGSPETSDAPSPSASRPCSCCPRVTTFRPSGHRPKPTSGCPTRRPEWSTPPTNGPWRRRSPLSRRPERSTPLLNCINRLGRFQTMQGRLRAAAATYQRAANGGVRSKRAAGRGGDRGVPRRSWSDPPPMERSGPGRAPSETSGRPDRRRVHGRGGPGD